MRSSVLFKELEGRNMTSVHSIRNPKKADISQAFTQPRTYKWYNLLWSGDVVHVPLVSQTTTTQRTGLLSPSSKAKMYIVHFRVA